MLQSKASDIFLLDIAIWCIHTYLNKQLENTCLKYFFPDLNYIEITFPAIWLKACIVCSLHWVFYFKI